MRKSNVIGIVSKMKFDDQIIPNPSSGEN